jgi:hypothetical protein
MTFVRSGFFVVSCTGTGTNPPEFVAVKGNGSAMGLAIEPAASQP